MMRCQPKQFSVSSFVLLPDHVLLGLAVACVCSCRAMSRRPRLRCTRACTMVSEHRRIDYKRIGGIALSL